MKNGLTKSVSQITEYTINVKKDSLDQERQDTLMVRERKYNNNGQIIHLTQKTLFDEGKMEIDYIYNEFDKIEKEVVKLYSDSLPLIVDYFYKDTLLYQSKSLVKNPSEKFEQIDTYYYRKNNTKEKVISTQIFIDLKLMDTFSNYSETTYFNNDEMPIKAETLYKSDSKRNRKKIYKYSCETLIEINEYTENDSLISTLKYHYDRDKYDNWTSTKIYENSELKTILKREINYK